MCIFSRGVRHVGATRIFVGDRADGRQALIYAMEVELEALSDDALRAKTQEFKDRVANGTALDDLLVEAFAVVREGSDRKSTRLNSSH